jgi:hypothetical protein
MDEVPLALHRPVDGVRQIPAELAHPLAVLQKRQCRKKSVNESDRRSRSGNWDADAAAAFKSART